MNDIHQLVAERTARTNLWLGVKPKPNLETMKRDLESMPVSVPYKLEVRGDVILSRREFGKVVKWYGQTVCVYQCQLGSGEVGLHYQGVNMVNQVGMFFEPEWGTYGSAGFKEVGWTTKHSKIDVQVTCDREVSSAEVRSQTLTSVNEELLKPVEVAESTLGKAVAHSFPFEPTPLLVRVLTELARLDASSKEEWEKKLLKDLRSAETTREIMKDIKIEWIGFGQSSDRDRYTLSSKSEDREMSSGELIRRLLVKGRSGGSLIVRT